MNLPQLKLVSFKLCPYVQRARIVMLEKQIEHTVEYIDLDAPPPWFYDISPLEKVPVLLVDERPLFESMVICEYLDEITPGSLYPADAFERAQLRAWSEFGNDILDQHYTLVKAREQPGYKRARGTLIERLETLDEILGDGPYFAGETFMMVDAVYAPIFRYLNQLESEFQLGLYADLDRVPRWADALLARPSVQDAVPEMFTSDYRAYLLRQAGVLAKSKEKTIS